MVFNQMYSVYTRILYAEMGGGPVSDIWRVVLLDERHA